SRNNVRDDRDARRLEGTRRGAEWLCCARRHKEDIFRKKAGHEFANRPRRANQGYGKGSLGGNSCLAPPSEAFFQRRCRLSDLVCRKMKSSGNSRPAFDKQKIRKQLSVKSAPCQFLITSQPS